MKLNELQSLFSEAMIGKDGHGRAATKLESQLRSTEKLTAARQIEIYRNSTLSGLQNALSELFPVCLRLVGKDFFYALSLRYVYHFHSVSPDLGGFWQRFSVF